MDPYVWLITFSTFFTLTLTETCKREQKCKVSRVHGMKGADCFDRNIKEFPTQCLSSDLEIIDLSFNRIRRLTKNDLEKFSDLKMLYLAENSIQIIDETAFEGKDDLNTLDLSTNSVLKLPPVVFHLPSLKSLYLGQNWNINIVDSVEKAKPVTSPLVQLDISSVMSIEQSQLPDFGVLPFLTKYNISGNKLINVTTKNFAGLCSLKILDTTNVSVEYVEPCHCWTINRWLNSRKVQFKPFSCEISENECLAGVPHEDLQLYEKCIEQREDIVQKSRMLKIIIPIVVVAVTVILVAVYFVVRRRQKQKQKQRTNRPEEQTLYNNAFLNKM